MSAPQPMKALAVNAWGEAPQLITAPVRPVPSTQTQVRVLASGFPQLVRSQATGVHYTTSKAPLPYIPGIDGVGTTNQGELVYINTLTANPPGGAFAEYVNVEKFAMTPIKSAIDNREAATKVSALMNPTLSSWMALKYRAKVDGLQQWNILIVGATSTSGRIAARLARHLGAIKVIGAARESHALEQMKQAGTLDVAVVLDKDDVAKTDFSVLSQESTFPHVVLDYIWGPTALAVLSALPHSARSAEMYETRYVHIGTLGREPEVSIPGPLLRSKNVVITGSGPGSWSVKALAAETGELVTAILEVLPTEGWRKEYGVIERKLEDIREAWDDTGARTVFVLD